jgi:hypothetical protein
MNQANADEYNASCIRILPAEEAVERFVGRYLRKDGTPKHEGVEAAFRDLYLTKQANG